MAREENAVVELTGVHKAYDLGEGRRVVALRGVDLTVGEGEFVAVTGPSGSGKSTLLAIAGLLTRPSAGEVRVDGQRVDELDDDARASLRNHAFGYLFPFAALWPSLTALENVLLPRVLAGTRTTDDATRALALLEEVGVAHLADRLPHQMSAGEQRRVALARALANRPRVLMADEPTANLDTDTAERVIERLARLPEEGTAVVAVTHDPHLAARADRVVRMVAGCVEAEG
ncbi:ABC transporter ATP-binding protein [Calditerricola satsumensis]|uniref:ABC transporter ATP-binding protein n=1 Tax=Calditerricola satsumensis TaxID=373054 RepID=A0A8J3B815_9BACI|nr:ABC transporter ATP-binding protein [Calditerricola satsumensis]GGK01071.1 ABC transporter ATP-binding protein [Calditerricola satsumensis]